MFNNKNNVYCTLEQCSHRAPIGPWEGKTGRTMNWMVQPRWTTLSLRLQSLASAAPKLDRPSGRGLAPGEPLQTVAKGFHIGSFSNANALRCRIHFSHKELSCLFST